MAPRWLLALLAPPTVSAAGAGAWSDPAHRAGPHSFAGTRFVAESPEHVLTMVGSDDGTSWWALQGSSSGSGHATITFDFSSKGGPPALAGRWSREPAGTAGTATITWPDGNSWAAMPQPVTSPTPGTGATDDSVGVFYDPNHYIGPRSYAGLRILARNKSPPHTFRMVGCDDGATWWALEGRFSGAALQMVEVDFSPKGGPVDLRGQWQTPADGAGTSTDASRSDLQRAVCWHARSSASSLPLTTRLAAMASSSCTSSR